jgi:peptidoglycan LD-endopeptidase CwlK
MPIELSPLDNELAPLITELIRACDAAGVTVRPYIGLRDPFDQARLWRQSRSTEEINKKIDDLVASHCAFLAECLSSVGPQYGRPVTNAIPGLSWHQYGEAVDFLWIVDGAAEWSTRKRIDGVNGFLLLADKAEALGLTAGGHWQSFKDWAHVQLRAAASPLPTMTLQEIDTAMKERFGA